MKKLWINCIFEGGIGQMRKLNSKEVTIYSKIVPHNSLFKLLHGTGMYNLWLSGIAFKNHSITFIYKITIWAIVLCYIIIKLI